jgi:hypothetical protein
MPEFRPAADRRLEHQLAYAVVRKKRAERALAQAIAKRDALIQLRFEREVERAHQAYFEATGKRRKR